MLHVHTILLYIINKLGIQNKNKIQKTSPKESPRQ